MTAITLYRRNRLGIGSWRIWADGPTINIAHTTTLGGSEVYHTESVPSGLAGRSLDEQVQSRVRSRVNRQLDKGYVENLDRAVNSPLRNTLDQPPPMLAQKYCGRWPGQSAMQPKLDGYRLMTARNIDGNIICYSRMGKELPALVHIRQELQDLPDETILDGELYSHGVPLQTIASRAKLLQPETLDLVYHVYDCVSPDSFPHRYAEAAKIVRPLLSSKVVMVPNEIVNSEEDAWAMFQVYRQDGYEGGMLRTLNKPYESGTRSSSLLKFKSRHDAEFKIIDVVPGEDGLGILVCGMDSGRTFKTLAPGNHGEKKKILDQKQDYVGRYITVEYANLTNDGIPFHAVAIRFREDL